MKTISLICSMNFGLIFGMAKFKPIIFKKMTFKAYYSELGTDEKNLIRDYMVPKYMSNSTFYDKVRDNGFKLIEIEKLEEITKQEFDK